MKKFTSFAAISLIVILALVGCAKKTETPKAAAGAENLLKLIPGDVQGVFGINIKQAMSMEFVNKMLESDESAKKYQEFVAKTGIDPKTDIDTLVFGIMGGVTDNQTKGAAVVSMKYDKAALLNMINEEAENPVLEEEYSGYTLYKPEGEEEDIRFCFLDETLIALGNLAGVQAVIDVKQGNKDNVFKNEQLSKLISLSNKNATLWGAAVMPEKAMNDMASSNPMLANLSNIMAMTMFFDYKDKSLISEIRLMSDEAEKNKKIAEFLTSLKGLGAMFTAEKPEVGELLQKIEISSSDDYAQISINIPEELLKSLTAKPQPKTEPGEETEEE